MSEPAQGDPVDALKVIEHLQRMLSSIIHDLAVSRARIDQLEEDKAELEREARVREATTPE